MKMFSVALLALAAACGGDDDGGDGDGDGEMVLTSSDLDDGAFPIEYTCDGQDLSPPFEWSGAPEGTAGYGLVLIDETSALFHWVIWDIPADVSSLPEGIEKTA